MNKQPATTDIIQTSLKVLALSRIERDLVDRLTAALETQNQALREIMQYLTEIEGAR